MAYIQPGANNINDNSQYSASSLAQHLGQCSGLFATSLEALQEILMLAGDLCGNYELDNAIIVADQCSKFLHSTSQLASEHGLRPQEGVQVCLS